MQIDEKIRAVHNVGQCIPNCPCCAEVRERADAYLKSHPYPFQAENPGAVIDAQRSTPLEGAQFSPTLDRMMSAEIAAANAHLDAKEAKIDAGGYGGTPGAVPVGLHPFLPHSDPTSRALVEIANMRAELRTRVEKEIEQAREIESLQARLRVFQQSVSPSDAMRARVHKADDENRRLGEIVDEQAEYISKLEAHINILTNAKGKDPVAMRRALIGVTDKIAAPYHEEAQRLRAGIVEISKERDTLSDELKQRRYETAEIRDALVVYVLRYLKHKGESDAMALRLAKLAATHALCNHAKPPESVHPSHLSTVIEALEDEIKRLTECLAVADADRVPLRMDLDAARNTIARMQLVCSAAQTWVENSIVKQSTYTHDLRLVETVELYEMASAQAANAEEIEPGISSPDDDIPF